MSTNLTGTFFMSQSFGKYLIEHKLPGSIIQVASVHGIVGAKERSTYGISKAAILHMTKMLAIEWAENQIRVNAVAPGRLETDSPSRASTGNNPEYMANMLNKIPLHRLATAQEVAQAIYYLASPAANAITGQTIVLDGGLVAG
jgi:NAD(P)-dependent dehydrogenase (short-subunit alcohol dehydrogenase family)